MHYVLVICVYRSTVAFVDKILSPVLPFTDFPCVCSSATVYSPTFVNISFFINKTLLSGSSPNSW
jgi:hypothetical protein